MNKINYETLKNSSEKDKIDYKEYNLYMDNNKYLLSLKRTENEILIFIDNYSTKLNLNEIQKLINNNQMNSIDKIFSFFQELLENNRVYIKQIEIDKTIKLLFKSNIEKNNWNEKYIEFILIHKNINKDYIINCINQNNYLLQQQINNLSQQNERLKHEIKNIKINKSNNIINKTISFSLNKNESLYYCPLYIQFYKNITSNSYAHFGLDNTFIIVESIWDISYIIYSTKDQSIISQDIINFQMISEIKNAHDNYITNFRHFFDKENKRDIIMSISAEDNNIKLWDLKDWNCLSNIKKINEHGSLFSACFIRDEIENKNFIITSNDNYSNSEKMKIFDFKGNKLKEINDSNHRTYIMDIFYDKNKNKYYIITGIEKGVISYDFMENKIYNQYIEKNEDIFYNDHDSIVIKEEKEIVKMIESCEDGNIRIWDFHSAILLNIIEISERKLYGLCLWNKDFLFVGCDDNTLKLIDLRKYFAINNIKTEGLVINAKKISHIIYKDCLITQDWRNQIKIWIIKN